MNSKESIYYIDLDSIIKYTTNKWDTDKIDLYTPIIIADHYYDYFNIIEYHEITSNHFYYSILTRKFSHNSGRFAELKTKQKDEFKKKYYKWAYLPKLPGE